MTKMTFSENNHDDNGKVFISANTQRESLPTAEQVAAFAAKKAGGQWKASGGWHPTGDSNQVYMAVTRR